MKAELLSSSCFVIVVVKMLLLNLPICESGKGVASKYYFPKSPLLRKGSKTFKSDDYFDYFDDETLAKVEGLGSEPLGEFVFWARKEMPVYVTGDPTESHMVVLFYDEGGFSRNVLKVADSIAKTGGLLVLVPDLDSKFDAGAIEEHGFYVRRGRQSEVVVSANEVAGKTSEILQYVFDTVLGKLRNRAEGQLEGEEAVKDSLTTVGTTEKPSTSSVANLDLEAKTEVPLSTSSTSSTQVPSTSTVILEMTSAVTGKTYPWITHFEVPILPSKSTSKVASNTTELTEAPESASEVVDTNTSEVGSFGDSTSTASATTKYETLKSSAMTKISTPGRTTAEVSEFSSTSTWESAASSSTTEPSSTSSATSDVDTSTATMDTAATATTDETLGPTDEVPSTAATSSPTEVAQQPILKATESRPASKFPQDLLISRFNKPACVLGIGSGGAEVLRSATRLAISKYKCGVHIDTVGLKGFDAEHVQFPLLTMWSTRGIDHERFGKAMARKFGPRLEGRKRFVRMKPGFAGHSGNFSDPEVERAVKELVLVSTAYIRLFLRKPVLRRSQAQPS